MSDFHLTQMGHRFFEGTLPRLVKELGRLNDLLERLVLHLERSAHKQAPPSGPGPGPGDGR